MNTRVATGLMLASTIALAACQKKAPEELPPPPTETAPAPAPAPSGPGVGSQQHFIDAVGQQNTVVYFDTDQYNIDAEDQAKLQRQAQYFSQYSQVNFTIEGHADERGTREYNLALGERRANAAKNYLVSVGVPANRIRTISYGKERPVALGSNQAAWAQNRRAATVTIN
ncbi:peptidoglycan-associated lipoprotein Pal [Qipengyuania citrea]|jgi:peptidoglycan-associated lipoprotein|uniref:Peptidoglycan-associated lipoprotein n=2 Tax=Qipengyuania TaxID=1855416 RepID=A0ABY4U3D9_9SPHN|nr:MULTISPECIES: peptidoglycan-associated lipoprotein Pal [Erythrobacteraceae]MBL4895973.1 peptidoglycan-associated lipoprotein Pal [Erythrobacter sp.]MEC7889455.1 peptidoglycan-associated lipoprotein Pal [Pseudomonadota bacterium]QPL40956.1 peptidoglycan-associated lipoprotein Pal [Erythrobacter sp. A30-3]MBX7487898.1 peptidoglycan-associated lipoprotein Pal [Qipengyuania aerophila]MBY8333841.1 peptidoglycan-associated lipoprotein Pal [Qipengyuania pacifica]|tara:strand:+ start:1479 stop:1988 length:510 start_codon:yes stop_codon:yes gene_type:complete